MSGAAKETPLTPCPSRSTSQAVVVMAHTRAHVDVRIHGGARSVVVSALADTAATFTKVPGCVFDELGLKTAYETAVEIGDGRIISRRLAPAEVEIAGVRRLVLVAAGGDGERPLVGYTTLETLGFEVNTVTHELEPTPAIEYVERGGWR